MQLRHENSCPSLVDHATCSTRLYLWYCKLPVQYIAANQTCVIKYEALHMEARIGFGMSGVVWRGCYSGYPVAVKQLTLHTAAYADECNSAAAANDGEETAIESPGYYQDVATLSVIEEARFTTHARITHAYASGGRYY